MSEQVFPTKGNLMRLTKSLALAKTGYDLLDRKRNILVRETMRLVENARKIRVQINKEYMEAYAALQKANLSLGIVDEIAKAVPIDNGISLSSRSVMGVEIPVLSYAKPPFSNSYGYHRTGVQLDIANKEFNDVKEYTVQLAEIESSIYRLSVGIKKTQKRSNALKNIIIPRFEMQIKQITSALDEKEREEFARLKVIKKQIG